ncbi:MAG: DUF2079 domain-containing protein [Eubacteriales bacterium]|nr:DUF2079 domain-containing protein [Eubacteriales bacterium]
MNNIIRQTNKILKHITLEHCVIRFVMAWCFVSLFQMADILNRNFVYIDKIDYLKYVGFNETILLVISMFAAIYVLFEAGSLFNEAYMAVAEKTVLLLVSLVYGVTCVVNHTDIYFCIGITALLGFAVCYSVKDIAVCRANVSKTVFVIIMAVLGMLFIAFTGGCTIARYMSYSSPNFDLGLFSQMFHSMKTNLSMNTTSERDMLLSHFAVHVSPAFYLILPFYAVVSSPATLQLMQAVVIAAGLIPLAGICRNHKMSNVEIILVSVCYVAYPVMSGGCFYDIHENMFLPLFLLTFLYFIEKESLKGIIISMLLVFSVKEDAAIYVAFIAIYMIAGLKMYKRGFLVLAGALVYFSFTTVLLAAIGDGVMSFRFNNMILEENGNMLSIIKTVIMHPAYVLTQVFKQEKMEFMLQVLCPLLFMPLFSKKWYRFILLGPFVLFNLMSDYQYFHSIFFQYAFGSGTLLIYLTILNVSDMDEKIRNRVIPMLAAASVMFFSSVMWIKTNVIKEYFKGDNQETYAIIREGLDTIPDDASVIATTFLCPALSQHDKLYELYYTDEEAEYIALDLRRETTDYSVESYLNNSDYETVYYVPLKIAVFKKR